MNQLPGRWMTDGRRPVHSVAGVAASDIDRITALFEQNCARGKGPRIVSLLADERSDVGAFLDDVARVSAARVVDPGAATVVSLRCESAATSLETIQRVVRALAGGASPLLRQAAAEIVECTDAVSTYPSPWAFFRAVARWLAKATAEIPALIIISDADRIDAESLEVLSLVAAGAPENTGADGPTGLRGLVILGAPRETAPGPYDAEVRAWIAAGLALSIEARPFDRSSIASFLQTAPIVDTVWEKTRGRPGKLAEFFGVVPDSIDALGARRFESLNAAAREAMTAIAAFGRACPTDLVLSLGIDLGVVATLIRERFLVGDRALDLAQADDRDRILGTVSASARQRLHARIAVLLDHDARTEGQAAHHHAMAGQLADAERCALAACDALERHHAFGSAERIVAEVVAAGRSSRELLDRAVRYASARGDFDAALRFAAKRKAVAETLGDAVPALRDAVTFLTHLGRYDAAMGVIRWIKRRVRPLPDGQRIDLASSEAELLFHQGDLAAASELATKCREEVADDMAGAISPIVAIRLDNVLGKIAWQMGRYEAALSRFQVNLARAEESGDGVEKVRALTNLATVQIQRENYLRAEDLLKAAVREADSCGDVAGLAVAHLNLAALHHRTWDYGRAIDAYERAIGLLRKVGRRLYFARALCNYADLLTSLGDAVRAVSLADEAVTIARDAGDKHVLGIALGYLGSAKASLGHAGAVALLEEAIDLCRASNSARQTLQFLMRLVDVRAASFEVDEARRLLAAVAEEASRSTTVDAPEIAIWRRFLSAAVDDETTGAPRRAACDEAIRLAEATSDREAIIRAHRLAGSLARVEGDWDAAERHALATENLINKMRAALPAAIRARFDQAHDVAGVAADVWRAQISRATIEATFRSEGGGTMRRAAAMAAPTRMVAQSNAMGPVKRLIERVAPTNATVLVLGESGTGKELVAEELHRQSSRRARSFVSVNCAAIVETLLLSELFGHEKGAFTGAVGRSKGKFEVADGGTLFLDEIGDISPATQVALLRVLQEREFHRVGGAMPVRVDVRVICATNRNLEAMVSAGRFREDLFYRLNCVTVALPPLRERREDIPLLAQTFLAKCASEMRRPHLHFSTDALSSICRFNWPGNVRQLENAVRSVAVLSDGDEISLDNFRAWGGTSPSTRGKGESLGAAAASSLFMPCESSDVVGLSERVLRSEMSLDDLRHEVEMTCIARALQETDWNITHAATLLKMKRPRLSQIVKANLETLRSLQVGNA